MTIDSDSDIETTKGKAAKQKWVQKIENEEILLGHSAFLTDTHEGPRK